MSIRQFVLVAAPMLFLAALAVAVWLKYRAEMRRIDRGRREAKARWDAMRYKAGDDL